MKSDLTRTAMVAVCLSLLSGCALLSPVKIETKKNVLNKVPIDVPSEKTRPATLLVLAPETNAIYDTTQMAYTTEAYQIGYFSQNEWAETPSQMIQPLIVQTIRNTGFFSEVVSPPHFGRHTFALRTEIQELKQDFTSDPATLQLAMRFDLSREATNEVTATKELSVQEPMREKTPYAGVVAANDAMAKLLRELAKFIVAKAD
ncbi:MAG TPA: ABC-type transport auxiliary lipoprotein family protein [Casimicrobiaceae bacterium]|nr:ABC-type transport auxiliary lipoprotein family protein [Casimicrobiaceae bacterium]